MPTYSKVEFAWSGLCIWFCFLIISHSRTSLPPDDSYRRPLDRRSSGITTKNKTAWFEHQIFKFFLKFTTMAYHSFLTSLMLLCVRSPICTMSFHVKLSSAFWCHHNPKCSLLYVLSLPFLQIEVVNTFKSGTSFQGALRRQSSTTSQNQDVTNVSSPSHMSLSNALSSPTSTAAVPAGREWELSVAC